MPESTPNSTGDNLPDNSGTDKKFEILSAYIDREIKSDDQYNEVMNKIESDPDYHNRYIFEKNTKELLRSRIKSIETPVYLYKNIGNGIQDIIKELSLKQASGADNPAYTAELQNEKSNLLKYLTFGSIIVVILIAFSFALNSYLKKNPDLMENDLVSVSRKVFDKVESGKINLKFKSGNAKELEDSLNRYSGFKVFIPDVKDAVLIGGVCDELNGEILVHIIHKKGSLMIYTLQANYKNIMTNRDKVILCDEFKENIFNGRNWFPCNKDKNSTVVIWFKDNVICSSVAHMESDDIYSTLTNYK